MFGSLGFNEILFIMVLALLIFGPKRLPQIGRTMGKAIGEFRRASSDLKRSMEVELTLAEERERATAHGPATSGPVPVAAAGAEPRRKERDAASDGASPYDTDEIPQAAAAELTSGAPTSRVDDGEPDYGVPEPPRSLAAEETAPADGTAPPAAEDEAAEVPVERASMSGGPRPTEGS